VHVATWLAWCRGVELDVASATTDDVEDFREALIGAGYRPSTVAIKLTLVRRLYDAANGAGLRQDNPTASVAAPRSKRAAEDFGYLSGGDLALLLRGVPQRTAKHGQPLECDLRDKALLALLSLQVLRTVEIRRANSDDVRQRGEHQALLVHGKGHDRLVFLRQDVAACLQLYLEQRGPVRSDHLGLPLITATGNRSGGLVVSGSGQIHDVDLDQLAITRSVSLTGDLQCAYCVPTQPLHLSSRAIAEFSPHLRRAHHPGSLANRTWAIDDAVKPYLAAGALPDRMVLEVNAYARVYGGVQNVNHGLYQPYTGPAGDSHVLAVLPGRYFTMTSPTIHGCGVQL
jgi:hypothetical protein